MARLKCPKCKGHQIILLANDLNYKTKTRTSINLNPLHPLTVFNSKTIRKEKKSLPKMWLNLMTGGISGKIIGTNKNHNEYLCQTCGKRWVGK